MSATTIPQKEFSLAKAQLSDIMTAVVHKGQPHLVLRRRGKEAMLLIRPEDMLRALSACRFEPTAIIDAGEVTVRLERFGLLGFGETLNEAMDDLVEELRAYAQEFLEHETLYLETDRASHLPWLLRFALTPTERQRELLHEDARALAPRLE